MVFAGTARGSEGVIPILPVPFHETGAVDEMGFRRVVYAAIDDGVHRLGIARFCASLEDVAQRSGKGKTISLSDAAAVELDDVVS